MLVFVRDLRQSGALHCFSPQEERCHPGSASKPCPKPGDRGQGDDGGTHRHRVSTWPWGFGIRVGLGREFEGGKKRFGGRSITPASMQKIPLD